MRAAARRVSGMAITASRSAKCVRNRMVSQTYSHGPWWATGGSGRVPAREEGAMAVRELTYGEAVREAIAEEMRRDPRVFLIGEDVAEAGHPFKTLVGLVQEFGSDRVI